MTERLTHDNEDMTVACPHCDSGGGVYARTGENTHADPEREYYCENCHTGVDEPVEREKKQKHIREMVGGGGKSGLQLEDMNPEDVGLSPLGERQT